VDGDLVRLLMLMKGLPVGYQKDMQEDKEAVFDAADTTAASVSIMTGVVAGLGQNREAMHRAASAQEMIAAGLAVALRHRAGGRTRALPSTNAKASPSQDPSSKSRLRRACSDDPWPQPPGAGSQPCPRHRCRDQASARHAGTPTGEGLPDVDWTSLEEQAAREER